jgi:hypothetical protein
MTPSMRMVKVPVCGTVNVYRPSSPVVVVAAIACGLNASGVNETVVPATGESVW